MAENSGTVMNSGVDYGTVVWNDNGVFNSVTIVTHEIART